MDWVVVVYPRCRGADGKDRDREVQEDEEYPKEISCKVEARRWWRGSSQVGEERKKMQSGRDLWWYFHSQ